MTFDTASLDAQQQHALLQAVQYLDFYSIITHSAFWFFPLTEQIWQISPLVFWNGFAFFSLILFSGGLFLLQQTLLKIHSDYFAACFYMMGLLHWLAAWIVLQQLHTLALAGPLSSLGVMGLGYFLFAGLVVQIFNLFTTAPHR